MAIGDRYSLSIQGTLCGSTWNLDFEYEQVQPDQVGILPGFSLVDGWMNTTFGPWGLWRALVSDELTVVCATYSSISDKGAVAFSTSNQGANTVAALPPTVAVMVHEWAASPYPKNFSGRCYFPGVCANQVNGPGWTSAFFVAFNGVAGRLINLRPAAAPATMFRMVPTKGFVANPVVTPNNSVFVGNCFMDPLIRRIKSRKPDLCQIVGAQGVPPGIPSFDPDPET